MFSLNWTPRAEGLMGQKHGSSDRGCDNRECEQVLRKGQKVKSIVKSLLFVVVLNLVLFIFFFFTTCSFHFMTVTFNYIIIIIYYIIFKC